MEKDLKRDVKKEDKVMHEKNYQDSKRELLADLKDSLSELERKRSNGGMHDNSTGFWRNLFDEGEEE